MRRLASAAAVPGALRRAPHRSQAGQGGTEFGPIPTAPLLQPDLSGVKTTSARVLPLGSAALRELAGRQAVVLTSATNAAPARGSVHLASPVGTTEVADACLGAPLFLTMYVWIGGGGVPAFQAAGAAEVRPRA